MVNVVRTAYHYSDEYILGKSVRWVKNAYELCLRDRYNDNLQLAHLVMHLYAAGMSKEVKPPQTFGQMLKEQRGKKEKSEGIWFADDRKLGGLGIKVKSPIAKEQNKQ